MYNEWMVNRYMSNAETIWGLTVTSGILILALMVSSAFLKAVWILFPCWNTGSKNFLISEGVRAEEKK